MQQCQGPGYAKPVQWHLIVIVNVYDIVIDNGLASCCNAAHMMCKWGCQIR